MLFKVVDYYLCVVFFLKHPHMLVSVDPLLVRIQFACGCQSYPVKADYRSCVFLSCKNPYKVLYEIPAATITDDHKPGGLKPQECIG